VVPVASSIGVSAAPAAVDKPSVPTFVPGPAISDRGLRHPATSNSASALAVAPKLKTFTATVIDNGTHYKYTIVGKNPAKAVTNASTTISTQLVPLRIVFANGDFWDPTVADVCDASATSLARTQNSPIFKPKAYTWGGASIGTAQYIDAFQRAEFWKFAQPTGINPTYHVKLKLTTLPVQTVNVPVAFSAESTAHICGSTTLRMGAVEINWFDAYLQNVLIPSLTIAGLVAPNTFPLFLVHNVVEYITVTSQCCVLGYHNAYQQTPTSQIQTYSLSMYDNTGLFFGGVGDVSILAHEVGEWADDPYVNNPTRPWGHIGQVGGCQNNLEVGDPLTGTTITVPLGGFNYHPQELVFFSWFYRQVPTLGIPGWYSNNGTFTTVQGTCV
jgi:hypothetical protein